MALRRYRAADQDALPPDVVLRFGVHGRRRAHRNMRHPHQFLALSCRPLHASLISSPFVFTHHFDIGDAGALGREGPMPAGGVGALAGEVELGGVGLGPVGALELLFGGFQSIMKL
jgi:hypothetical protein